MNTVIYFRKSLMEHEELEACRKYFEAFHLISAIPKNSLAVGRYSLLPFYKDQEDEILTSGSKLINSYQQHLYVADLKNWYADLKDFTPKTYFRLEDIPNDKSFVLKGATNSKKQNWKTHMFAKDKLDAIKVHSRLCEDTLINQQDIYIREYIPLKTYLIGLQDLPITKEFRFFICNKKIVCGDFYWQNYVDDLETKPNINEVPKDFIQKIIDIIDDKINFYVIDVAQTENGEWIVIELNDGCQSGLSCNDPNLLYKNLYRILNE